MLMEGFAGICPSSFPQYLIIAILEGLSQAAFLPVI
jgi:hypothetical protein